MLACAVLDPAHLTLRLYAGKDRLQGGDELPTRKLLQVCRQSQVRDHSSDARGPAIRQPGMDEEENTDCEHEDKRTDEEPEVKVQIPYPAIK